VADTSVRASRHNLVTAVGYGLDGAATSAIHESFLVSTTTAGTLTLQWAQVTANATATVLSTSSYMLVTEVEVV
jgi:hypothetical protein